MSHRYPRLSYRTHRKFPHLVYNPLRGVSFQVVAEPCEPVPPLYYDLITWFNLPLPDYSFAIEPEAKERKIDAVLEKLKEGVARIHESVVFREFLLTMAKFHDYSIGNQILIMLQRPDATRVAGFMTWKDLGRYVKPGEKGIAILAPCLPPHLLFCPICAQQTMKVALSERDLREHIKTEHPGEDVDRLIKEAKEAAIQPSPTYFKVVYVFDVSQTEGKPLPEFVVPVLTGAVNEELFTKLLAHDKEQGLEVSFEPKPNLSPDIKGYYIGKEIWVKPDEPRAQQLKTLFHETAHYYTETVFLIPKAAAETIAESSAFVVGAHFGFDTGVRSFPYVALWAQDKKVLEANLLNIRKVSARIIDALASPSTLKEPDPRLLMEPFIKVGVKVRDRYGVEYVITERKTTPFKAFTLEALTGEAKGSHFHHLDWDASGFEIISETPSTLKEKERAGLCYVLAWRHIDEYGEGTLIHGQVWSEKLGQMIGHAWVETETGYIYEPDTNSYYPKDWLYQTFRAKEENTYTPNEARIMVVGTENYGPWSEAQRKAYLKQASSNPQPRAITHRGTEPEGIKIADELGVRYDGIQKGFEDIPDKMLFRVRFPYSN